MEKQGTSVAGSLLLILCTVVRMIGAQVGTSAGTDSTATATTVSHSRGFFNQSLSSSAIVNNVLSLQTHFTFSFRTCGGGVLLSQTGLSGDNLQISLTSQGYLQISWTKDGASDSLIITHSSLSNNRWYTFDNLFLQGTITVSVEQGAPPALYSEVISNSTFRRYLWDLDLNGGPGITIGSPGFTGCFQEGLSVPLSSPDTIATAVTWESCPLEEQIGCGDAPVNPCWQFPCQNGGTCDNIGDGQYTCTCPVTFSGTNCELDLGGLGCSISPCLNGGTCEPLETGSRMYLCQCVSGFAGVNCETDLNECLSEPCQNGAVCSDLQAGFSCDCSNTGYEGNMCQTNVDECRTLFPCLNGASCVDTPGSYKCQCPLGYAGQDCEYSVDECGSNPCQHGGTCVDYLGYYECECLAGYTGVSCETDIDECEGIACPYQYTVCVDAISSYQCVCQPGYTGEPGSCTEVNECESQPCLNGAPCVNLENRYECSCLPGYTGDNCESNIDDCATVPCANGATCIDEVNGFQCDCVPGYVGSTCAIDNDECSSNPCLNQATCNDEVNMYSCSCMPGWEGDHCEADIDECGSSPCLNGGQCINLLNNYQCVCLPGFTGEQCAVNIYECEPQPCMNGGACIDLVNGYSCDCTADWMGPTCMQVYDACSFDPCMNDGICTSSPPSHEYVCDCIPGYTGDQCETNIDDCVSHDCADYQVCVDGVNAFTCQCPLGYEGNQCEININECDSSPCQNGGTCVDGIGNYTCECQGALIDLTRYTNNPATLYQTGYKGMNCEESIDECGYEPSICLNEGMCQDNDGGFSCFCTNDGGILFFTGVYCEKSTDNCNIVDDPPACHNGGSCSSIQNGFECQCAPGFEGTRCQINIDECLSSPCLYDGTCIDGVNGYTCECIPGLSGTHCEENIDECDSNPCLNNGVCVDAINEYSCNCTDTGFYGSYCEININDCNPSACQHNSSCVDLIKDYSCNCFAGYSGKDCEVDDNECLSVPCLNGGLCLELSDQTRPDFSYASAAGFECSCMPGFSGSICETNINECESNPCQSGTCVDGINGFTCSCLPGYTGTLCEVEIDECEVYTPCQNGAYCIDKVAEYQCVCPMEYDGVAYGGVNCTVTLTGCDVNECLNGATCQPYLVNETTNTHNYSCQCAPGFTGFFCEIVTSMSLIGSSWLRYDLTDMQTIGDLQISWSFRTTLPSGVLLLSRSSAGNNYIVLYLENNNTLTFKYKLNTINGAMTISTNSNLDLNDAEWHRIEILSYDGQLQITLLHSDCPNGQCTETDQFIANSGFILGPLYFGGSDSSLTDIGVGVPGFIGCFEDVRYNDEWLTASAYAGSSSSLSEGCPRIDQCDPDPCYGHGACTDLWYQFQCACQRPYLGANCNSSYVAATFGYNMIPSFAIFSIPDDLQDDIKQNVDISLFMRTRKSDSFLFYLGTSPSAEPSLYTSGVIVAGSLYISLKLDEDVQTFKFEEVHNVADGEEHYINVIRNGQELTIQVDNKIESFANLIQPDDFAATQFNVGFMPTVEPMMRRRRRDVSDAGSGDIDVLSNNLTDPQNAPPFEGTLQDVRVKDISIAVFPSNDSTTAGTILPSDASNVTEGVVTTDHCTLSTPCENNATCENVVLNDYQCHCPEGFRGKNCDENDYCLYAICPGNATCQDLSDGYECVSEATFNGVSTSLQYAMPDTMDAVDTFTISAKFRTRQLHNTIIHLRSDSGQYVTIGFTGALLTVRYNLGTEVNYPSPVVDSYDIYSGNWQQMELTFTRDGIRGSISPQDSDVRTLSFFDKTPNGEIESLFSGSPTISLGGVDDSYRLQYSGMFFTASHFKGCLNEVRINDRLLPFFSDSQLGNETSSEQFDLIGETALRIGCYGDPVCDTNACENNATCVDIFNAYECSCVLGFNGSNCELNIDDCVFNDCMNGATCVDAINDYSCVCVPGFTGDMCQENIDECLSDPCVNNASCQDLVNDYFCNCTSGYTGRYCQLDVTDNCDNEPCQNNGTCTQLDNTTQSTLEVSFNCTCQPGYEGVRCENETDYCESSPCLNQATCRSITQKQDYECDCLHGYTGDDCETEIDECDPQPCLNGATCIDKVGGYECNCSSGWEGSTCELDINECNLTSIDGKAPCENGECINLDGSYECDCTGTGYDGDRCQHEINECLELDPCMNDAQCENTDGSYYCNCTLGYEGTNCENANCSYEQCLYGGTCTIDNDSQTWSCQCPEFFEGDRCEVRGPCVDGPCENGGTCTQEAEEYTCLCSSAWQGQNCTEDVDECETDPCVHGTCNNTDGGFHCDCTDTGYEGVRCDEEIDECESQPCQNNGVCGNGINEYICNCTGTGFEGTDCEDDIDECDRFPLLCQHGGTCENLVGSFRCSCAIGYIGDTCFQEDLCEPIYADHYCSNHGNCTSEVNNEMKNVTFNCDCHIQYTGVQCQTMIDDGDDNVLGLIIGFTITALLLILLAAVIAFIIHARKERATHGTYSPSRQEMSGSRVEMGHVMKPPPEERLI